MVTRIAFEMVNKSTVRGIIFEGEKISSQESLVWSVRDILETRIGQKSALFFASHMDEDTFVMVPLGMEITNHVGNITQTINTIIKRISNGEKLVDPFIEDLKWAPEGTSRYRLQLSIKARAFADQDPSYDYSMDIKDLLHRMARELIAVDNAA